MISSQIQIKIQNNENWLGASVWIFQKLEDGKISIFRPEKRIWETYDIGAEDISPSFYLLDDMLKPLAEAIDQKGIRIDKDSVREGELKATKYHLEDLRTLLRIKEKNFNAIPYFTSKK